MRGPMRFCYKIHRSGSGVIVAIADSELVGEKLSEKGPVVSRDFYCEKSGNESDVPKIIKSADIVNALGNHIVGFLVESGIIKKEETRNICGVMHAQIFVM